MLGSAGGITSLISYPALLAVGISPLAANVTNAVALIGSGVGSTLNSRPELADQRPRLRSWVPLAALGGSAGAALLLLTPSHVFDWIVPFLVAAAALLLLAQPRITSWRESRQRPHNRLLVPLGIAGVSVYSGYFGAGAGIMILALLLVLVEQNLPRANALKNTLLMLADLLPAVVFALAGPVVWTAAVPLAAGSIVGGSLGPVVTRRAPKNLLRIAIALTGLGLAGWLLANAVG
jgi:uncharacterized protein